MNIAVYPKEEVLARWREDKASYGAGGAQPPSCLRCGQPLPEDWGECALSRHIDVGICPDCGTDEAMRDWNDTVLPLRDWYALKHGIVQRNATHEGVTLVPICGFKEVFQQPRRAVWGHPNGFPMSELCYVRADYDGYRWHNTWEHCQDMPKDTELFAEVDGFYDALIELPEFQNLQALKKMCKSYAKIVAAEDPNYYNLYAETPHFYIWLRLITRARDNNLYCHYFYKEQPDAGAPQGTDAR